VVASHSRPAPQQQEQQQQQQQQRPPHALLHRPFEVFALVQTVPPQPQRHGRLLLVGVAPLPLFHVGLDPVAEVRVALLEHLVLGLLLVRLLLRRLGRRHRIVGAFAPPVPPRVVHRVLAHQPRPGVLALRVVAVVAVAAVGSVAVVALVVLRVVLLRGRLAVLVDRKEVLGAAPPPRPLVHLLGRRARRVLGQHPPLVLLGRHSLRLDLLRHLDALHMHVLGRQLARRHVGDRLLQVRGLLQERLDVLVLHPRPLLHVQEGHRVKVGHGEGCFWGCAAGCGCVDSEGREGGRRGGRWKWGWGFMPLPLLTAAAAARWCMRWQVQRRGAAAAHWDVAGATIERSDDESSRTGERPAHHGLAGSPSERAPA